MHCAICGEWRPREQITHDKESGLAVCLGCIEDREAIAAKKKWITDTLGTSIFKQGVEKGGKA